LRPRRREPSGLFRIAPIFNERQCWKAPGNAGGLFYFQFVSTLRENSLTIFRRQREERRIEGRKMMVVLVRFVERGAVHVPPRRAPQLIVFLSNADAQVRVYALPSE